MKKILLSFCLALFVSTVFSQVLVEDNFDSYTVGDKIAAKAGTPWGTWSNAPGGAEDGAISSDFASSPDNSLFIDKNNDVVMLFDDKVEGKFQIEFKMLVKSGFLGYFNVIQDLNGSNSKWGIQVFFNSGGNGVVDSGDPDKSFSYSYDTWIPILVDIDLDDDFYTFKIDNNILASGLWSKGTAGGGQKKLDAVNFYGVTDGLGSKMYIDDVVISKALRIPAPSDFTATLVNDKDVDLSWTAPDMVPDSYSVYRDGDLIADGVTNTDFMDLNIYPGEASYFVRAIYTELGISDKSDLSTVERSGGSARDLVLFEVGTGTGCPNCPSAARGVDQLVEDGRNVAILEYHNYNADDPFNCEDAASRTSYYGITGYPTQYHDGTRGVVGGGYTGTLFDSYDGLYQIRSKRLALYSLSMDVDKTSETEYVAHITMNENSNYYGDLSKSLRVALTETDILYSWQGLSHVDFAVRNMFPNAAGTSIDFSSNSEQTIDIPFQIDPSWDSDNCELVVFLQSDDNKEVLQTIKFDIKSLSSTDDLPEIAVDVYPNPVRHTLFTTMDQPFDYAIHSITGSKVASGVSNGVNIDIKAIQTGIYILTISTEDGIAKRKFIKE